MGVCDTTVIHKGADFVDGVTGVTIVLIYEADLLSVHLGGLDIMTVGHL